MQLFAVSEVEIVALDPLELRVRVELVEWTVDSLVADDRPTLNLQTFWFACPTFFAFLGVSLSLVAVMSSWGSLTNIFRNHDLG